ncbi:hypothetical protein BJ085DRAFT_36378 [Dimargaris cristalligena]|uniref:Ketoreductase domain-containing protein n=1 Tax=Dimargaris cristalligena TaxID=215637 RepID=A0A4P9ZZ28_9FUNG|nr:hypothetical protein BJ085DRAFT_36378 [Dimargaris cristalligena]|eukprot:RKP39014.1 hypothetical protein BJ085DRAFT_36378 [Dimargaris cristalligena]
MAFMRNHLLMLLVQAVMTLLSAVLRVVDYLSFAGNHLIQSALSSLPKGKPPFPIILPAPGFHPALFITGTSSGIGRDLALALAGHGYTVLAGVRRTEDGDQLREQFTTESQRGKYRDASLAWDTSPSSRASVGPGRIVPLLIDVTSDASMNAACRQVHSIIQEYDVPLVGLINNAGVSGSAPMEIASPGFVNEIFAVNYHGPVKLTQRLLPTLRQNRGRIINISSVASWMPGAGFGAYCASKAALRATTLSWRLEIAKFGVSMSIIEPGRVQTALWGKLAHQLHFHQTRLDSLQATIPSHTRTSPPPPSEIPLPWWNGPGAAATLIDNESHTTALNGYPAARGGTHRRPSSAGPDPLAASLVNGDGDAPTTSTSSSSVIASGPNAPLDPTRAKELYRPIYQQIQDTSQMAPLLYFPTAHCIDAVVHALTASFPKVTYRVGWDARLASIALTFLGEPFVEWVFRLANAA